MAAAPARAALLLALVAAAAAQSNPRPIPGAASDRGSYEICPQQPSLHCKNGSTCEAGVADFGRHHENLDLQTHEGGYYCKCLPGYIGHECAIHVDDCEGDAGSMPSDPKGILKSCYHGAQCRTNGSGFYCDCAQLNKELGPVATKFAGLMCQHESTGFCAASLMGGMSPKNQFCTNHGKCVKLVTEGEPHPGCACKEGWLGDHCEIRQDPLSLEESSSAVAGKVLFSLLVVAMGCVAGGIGFVLVKARRKEKAAANAAGTEGAEKTVVGAGDLEPDGSGTLGKETADEGVAEDAADVDGDMELMLNEEDTETATESEEAEAEIV